LAEKKGRIHDKTVDNTKETRIDDKFTKAIMQ